MNGKKIFMLSVAILILIGIVFAGYIFLDGLQVKIDPRAYAKETFEAFKKRVLTSDVHALSKDEKVLTERWSEVEDLCVDSINSIADDYARGDYTVITAISAIKNYKLFPVKESYINSAIAKIERIEEGRNEYKRGMIQTDALTAIKHLCNVQTDDAVYYPQSCTLISEKLELVDLNNYTKSRLSSGEAEETIEFLQKIFDMTENQTVKDLLFYATEYNDSQTNTVPYKGNIEILSVRNLMAFPEYVYTEDSKYQNTYDSTLITPTEFSEILNSLYEKDYILIDITSLSPDNLSAIDIPAGKKPFALIIDDLTYPASAKGSGVCDRLSISDDGRLCTVTDSQLSYDNETIPILESFLAEHPDFTFKGARGCISLTGYNGILGYDITDPDGLTAVTTVVEKLKESGWTFACHTYSYADMKKASLDGLTIDEKAWAEKVGAIVGGCKVYIWPYGSSVRSGAKHEYLRKVGYSIFLGQGINPYKAIESDGESIFLDRRQLSGYAMQNYTDEYSHLFNSNEILDPIRNKKEQD